jgi:hypothetical protein
VLHAGDVHRICAAEGQRHGVRQHRDPAFVQQHHGLREVLGDGSRAATAAPATGGEPAAERRLLEQGAAHGEIRVGGESGEGDQPGRAAEVITS